MNINLHQVYHDLTNRTFDPRTVNNPDDFEALYDKCRDLMRANGMMCPESPDDSEFMNHLPLTEDHPVMAFIYRATTLCEMLENGSAHYKQGDDWILETMENTTAACFQKPAAEDEMQPG